MQLFKSELQLEYSLTNTADTNIPQHYTTWYSPIK